MRGRVLLWILLGANIALAAMLLSLARLYSEKDPALSAHSTPAGLETVVKTNVVVRRQNFVWNQIESDDYPTYIANLRAIGCPEATIRDIIVADVNQLFARRRATEIVTAEQQWWRSEPDLDITQAAVVKLKALETERRSLLSRLLGAEWESSYYPYPAPTGNPLDGPLLGALSPQAKNAVHEIEDRSQERRQAYLEAMQKEGKPPDPAELERLRQETRAELAQVLGPEQLQEYLLRYSNNANALRTEMRGFDLGPDEFRNLFRARDSIDQQLQSLAGATDPASLQRRKELEQERDAGIREILGTDRFQLYKLNQDPLFRDSRALVQQIGAAQEKLLPLYEINHTTEVEQQRIRNDATLTPEERTEALHAIQASRENTLRKLFGEEAYERYLKEQKP
ncbi:MAG TPA: hypothetical protein VJW76_11555 [Verrucomicrobiae bacterium]|nr:hypothetical protein [Verrucomicrobiae bacterium]